MSSPYRLLSRSNGHRCPMLAFVGSVCFVTTAHAAAGTAQWVVADAQREALYSIVDGHPDEFAGLSVDPDRQEVIVRRVQSISTARIGELFSPVVKVQTPKQSTRDKTAWTVVLKPVKRSMRTLQGVRDKLTTAKPWASMFLPVFARNEVDVERNIVTVGVTAATPELVAEAQKNFGTAVELYVTKRMQYYAKDFRLDWVASGSVSAGTRLSVHGPALTGSCTTGFSIRRIGDPNLHGFTTAAHCFIAPSSDWLTDVSDGLGQFIGLAYGWQAHNGNFQHYTDVAGIGSLLWPFLTESGLWYTDAALIMESVGGSKTFNARPAVWVADDARRMIVGAKAVRVGDRVCFGGSFTKENCAAKIRSVNVNMSVGLNAAPKSASGLMIPIFVTVSNYIEASSVDGTRIAQPGDSGGPVYARKTLGTGNFVAEAVGAIEGGNPDTPERAIFLPLNWIIPMGWELWTANCDANRCTF